MNLSKLNFSFRDRETKNGKKATQKHQRTSPMLTNPPAGQKEADFSNKLKH
jgi:hypothetical protein